MRMRLFVVLAAGAAKKEENFLRVGTTHASSLRSWRVVVKRSTMPSLVPLRRQRGAHV
jgi:hypothetical protein